MLRRFVNLALNFFAGLAGNLIAGWIQQDVWTNLFTWPRITGTAIGVGIMLVVLAWLEREIPPPDEHLIMKFKNLWQGPTGLSASLKKDLKQADLSIDNVREEIQRDSKRIPFIPFPVYPSDVDAIFTRDDWLLIERYDKGFWHILREYFLACSELVSLASQYEWKHNRSQPPESGDLCALIGKLKEAELRLELTLSPLRAKIEHYDRVLGNNAKPADTHMR